MAREFDGSSEALFAVGSTDAVPPCFTSLWFFPDSSHAATLFVRQRNTVIGASLRRWEIRITAGGYVEVGSYFDNGLGVVAQRYVTSSNTYNTSDWNHVLGLWDPAGTYTYGVWLNGTRTTTTSAWVNPSTSGNRVTIGALTTSSGGTYSDYFDGRLAEIAEWLSDGTWTDVEMDKLVTGLYTARLSPDHFWGAYRPRYWPLILDEDRSEGYTKENLSAVGTPTIASHAPVRRRMLGKPIPSSGRFVSLGVNYHRRSRVLLP